jgi:hypothetical protein
VASYQPIGKGWEVKYAIRNDDIWKDYWVPTSYTNTTITQQTYNIQTATWHSWTGTGDHWYIRDEEIARVNAYGDRTGQYTYNWTRFEHPDYINPEQDLTWARWHVRERETAEQEQARLDREQQRREEASRHRLELEARREAEALVRAEAHARGMELLEMIMSDEEKALMSIAGIIHVRGSEGGLYEIHTGDYGVHGNIHQVDEHGCKLANLCVAPRMRVETGTLPLSDGYVGQYLAIKHNEAELRDHANFSFRRECTQPNVPILGQREA